MKIMLRVVMMIMLKCPIDNKRLLVSFIGNQKVTKCSRCNFANVVFVK